MNRVKHLMTFMKILRHLYSLFVGGAWLVRKLMKAIQNYSSHIGGKNYD